MRISVLAMAATLLMAIGCTNTACTSMTYQVTKLQGEVLSTHKTRAVYSGIKVETCRHLTALCPNRCEHGGSYALFTIKKYLDYQKMNMKYGEEQQVTFYVPLKNGQGERVLETSDALYMMIESLKEGEEVTLHWAHTYVSDGIVSEPRRVVTFLE